MAKSTSTQKFVPVRDVKENVLELKDGKLCIILLASSINFALKSQDEQKAILQQFQSFLNTLDFSFQVYIQSRRLNIEPYLAQLADQEENQYNDLMRIQLREYIDFVRKFTKEVDVMTKNFFVVVSYTPAQIDAKAGLMNLLSRKSGASSEKEETFEEHRSQLEQRVNIVEQGLNRLGVKTVPLQDDDLVELYYHIFNPQDITHTAPERG
jgi:type IV secretory pathway VirB4 component